MTSLSESADDYVRVVVDFGDNTRIVECRMGIQWIVQKRVRNTGRLWEGQFFCHTKEALLLYSGHPEHPILKALPNRFPEGREDMNEGGPGEIDSPPVIEPEVTLKAVRTALKRRVLPVA